MKKLTDTFGSHFECLEELYIELGAITQNPAFYEDVQYSEEDDTFHIGDAKIPNCYDGISNPEQTFRLDDKPSLEVRKTGISLIENMESPFDFHMVEYSVSRPHYLYAKYIQMKENRIHITCSIYDEHGVEIQRDTFIDRVSKELARMISLYQGNLALLQTALHTYFSRAVSDYELEKTPVYRSTGDYWNHGYRRDTKNLELVRVSNNKGRNWEESIKLTSGLRKISISGFLPCFASKEELAEAIALEENLEARCALIEYCKHKGVTDQMVSGYRKTKK